MNGSDVASASLKNGLLQNRAVNGNSDGHGQPTAGLNHTTASLPGDNASATLLENTKERAKSVMALSNTLGEKPPTPSRNSNGAASTPTPDPRGDGIVPNRKRSRSGSRLPRSSHNVEDDASRRHARDQAFIETYVNRQQLHTAAVKSQAKEFVTFLDESRAEHEEKIRMLREEPDLNVLGLGYAGYGNGMQDSLRRAGRIITPDKRRPPGGRATGELRISRKDQATQAEQIDELVPIRIDIEWDKIRLRDTFTWNIHDRVVPISLFARKLLEDMKPDLVREEHLVRQIENSIREQIDDFHPHVFVGEEALDPHLPYFAYKNDEMRIVIKLNITIGQSTLVDQFEWDINNPLNSPEDFAKSMTTDLSLSGEFTTAIAHSIREQCQLFTRSLYVTGHPFDGRQIEDHELLASFQPSPLPSVFRPHQAAKDFTPYLYELNEQELEKNEVIQSREERRQKRSINRRGGPVLPDLKDRRWTNRTLLVSSVLPGAVQSYEDSRLFKKVVTSNRGKRGTTRLDGFDDSDDSDSEESSIGSPAVSSHLLTGTARTRGMRGAATVAQAATRSTLARSATPDSAMLHHHETRTSGRRIVHDESSPDAPARKILKLRVPRQKFRMLLSNLANKSRDLLRTTPARPTSRQSSMAPVATPGSMGPPTTTPRMKAQSLPPPQNGTPTPQPSQVPPKPKSAPVSHLGRIEANGPPGPGNPPVSFSHPSALSL